jgi:hypothetical protein
VITLERAPRWSNAWRWAAAEITAGHYLRRMPDPRTSCEVFKVVINGIKGGALVFGRPEATRCGNWYGSVEDVAAGRCEVTRWQVLNLARVWLHPAFQAGGRYVEARQVPGYVDRRGAFRSTLASDVLNQAAAMIGCEYLLCRPPCFLEEPYDVRWLLSYCDTNLHRGTIYAAAGFELYRTNDRGIQTWRLALPGLTTEEDEQVRTVAMTHPRSVTYRAQRAQLEMAL